MRWLRVLVVSVLAAGGAACGGGGTRGTSTAESLEAMFERGSALRLRVPPDTPLVGPFEVLSWGHAWVAVDTEVGEVKVFGSNGNLRRVIGRPGDGPGEFRLPLAAAVLGDTMLAVYDAAHAAVSLFDQNGEFVVRWPAPVRSRALLSIGGDSLVVLSVPVAGAQHWGHVYTTDGAFKRSFLAADTPGSPLRRQIEGVYATMHSGDLVALRRTSNTLVIHDLAAGTDTPREIGYGHYVAPKWEQLVPPFQLEALKQWMSEQEWGAGVLSFGSRGMLIKFDRHTGDSAHYYYVLVREHGPDIVAGWSTTNIMTVRADTAFALELDQDGGARLIPYRLRF